MKNPIKIIDDFQQRTSPLDFVFGVVKKYGDDSASSLAALMTYYGFLSLFPLLLVLVTVLGLILTPHLRDTVVSSAVGQFPIVGNQLKSTAGAHSLKAHSVIGLIIGLLGTLYGSLGISQSAQYAMAQVWNVPGVDRPGFVPRMVRSVSFLGVLLLDVIVTTVLAGFSTAGGHNVGLEILAAIVTVAADVGLYMLAFRVLTPKVIETRCLLRGAALAGVGWAILQYVGSFLVAHELKNTSQVYGYFASVLGLLAFIFVAAELSMYAAEYNVVRERRLYPRSIVQPPLTDADTRVYTDIAKIGERRPEQRVEVDYPGLEGANGPAQSPSGAESARIVPEGPGS